MDQKQLILDRQIGQLSFYKFPYLDISLATIPPEIIKDLWKAWIVLIKNQDDAVNFLQHIVDRGRSIGLQVFLYIDRIDTPEEHRLTRAIMSLDRNEKVFNTPASGTKYSIEKLQRL